MKIIIKNRTGSNAQTALRAVITVMNRGVDLNGKMKYGETTFIDGTHVSNSETKCGALEFCVSKINPTANCTDHFRLKQSEKYK